MGQLAQHTFPSQGPYASTATSQGSSFPVIPQGHGSSQPAQSSVNPYLQSGGSNQNPIYHPASISSDNQITQLNETINKLQQEVNRLSIDKQNMGKRMKNLEGQMTRKSDNEQQERRGFEGQARVHFEVDEVTRSESARSYADGPNGNDSFRINSSEIYASGDYDDSFDGKLQDTMKKLVEEHREHSNELRKQIKLQKDSFEREKGALLSENQKLCTSLKCLKKEIHVLKHEKENLLQKIQKERRESIRRDERSKDEIASIKNEYERKLTRDSKRSNEVIQELQQKISSYEAKFKEIELKFRDELTLLQNKYAQERNQLEIQIRETDNHLKSKLESHYQAKLKTEKEKYERTLKELRREIQCLQDQRKEIQLKLQQDAGTGGRILHNESLTSNSKNQEFYKRLQFEFENRYAQEKRSLEDTIRDLKKEITELEKEKTDIKASYKEEKLEMEERYQREKKRLEERHRRDMDELKRSSDLFQVNEQSFISMGGIGNKEVLRPQHTSFQGKNTSLEIKNDLLESDIAFLKGRVRDLESRQTKILSFNSNKSLGMDDTKVKFDLDRTSIPRSLSFTDLRSISNNQHAVSRGNRSANKGFSLDDLEISRVRSGANGLNYQIGQNLINIKSCQGISSASKGGFFTGNDASTLGISNMSSNGILNEGVGLAGAGTRFSLPGGITGKGVTQGISNGLQYGNGVALNSGFSRFGFSRSSGFQSGNGMGLGSAMMGGMGGSSYPSNRLGVGSSVLTGLNGGVLAGYSNRMGSGVAAINSRGIGSGFSTCSGTRLGCGLAVLRSGELSSGFVNQNQVGSGSGMSGIGAGSSREISDNGLEVGSSFVGADVGGSTSITGNSARLMNSSIGRNVNTTSMSGIHSAGNSSGEMNGNLVYGNQSFSVQPFSSSESGVQTNVVGRFSGNGIGIDSILTSSQVVDPSDT